MLYGLYVSTAGAMVETTRQEAIANNLANLGTAGFKKDFTIFRVRKTEAQEEGYPPFALNRILEKIGGGIVMDETPFNASPGQIEPTGAPMDLAIEGEGAFAVTDGARTYYTRSGNFTRNSLGELTTSDGRFNVLGDDGKKVMVPADRELGIGTDGTVVADGEVVARIPIYATDDPQAFRKHGWTLSEFVGQGAPRAARGTIRQGFIEQSNVDPVSEMVSMINGYRAYEANTRLIREQDKTLQRIITDVPRVG